jgi:hypothetical protein
MHFHQSSRCLACLTDTVYSTPIVNILILAEMCSHCGFNDLVGLNDRLICRSCLDIHRADVDREMQFMMQTPPSPS